LAKGKMLGALSLSLILVLTTSALPVAAQEQTETPRAFDLRGPVNGTGPLARAATREAVRLAAAREPLSLGIEAVRQGGAPAASAWSRVRQLGPGTGIIVTVKNAPPVHGQFLAADESELTVLNGAGEAEHIARTDVAEISVPAKHIGRHARRGFLVGGIVGALVSLAGLAVAGCGSASSPECFGEVVLVVGGFGGLGAGMGSLVGSVVPRRLDVIYRAP